MPDRQSEITALLLKQYLFHGLEVAQVQNIVSRFRIVRYRPNQTVIYDGMPGLYFYIVYKGQVQVSTIVKKPFQKNYKFNLYKYGSGEFFGEEAILHKRNSRDTVRTLEETILLIIDNENFLNILEEYPDMKRKLKEIAHSRQLARNKRFTWLVENEAIMLMGRKHLFFLFRSLLLPIFLFILSFPLIQFTFTQLGGTTLSILAELGSLLMLGGSILWGIWNSLDWGNDYFVVTTNRVIWMEKVIGLYENRNEAPLYTILTVDQKSSLLGRILEFGDVSTRTYTGIINMSNVSQPKDLSASIEGQIKRLMLVAKIAEKEQIEKDVQKALGKEDPTEIDLEELVVKSKTKEKTKRKVSFSESLQSFLKVRVVEDGVITYRKHWYLLVQKTWLPLLLLLISIGVTTWLSQPDTLGEAQLGLIAVLLATAFFFGLFFWLGYAYMDWKNDIYKLTPEQIFQIYKKPLGTEVKKSASIENILTIVHERENLTGILLNFGTVVVSVGDTEIIFEGVFNPDRVHQDIADYQEALKRKKLDEDKERDRQKMVDWLMTYYKESEQMKNPGGSSNQEFI